TSPSLPSSTPSSSVRCLFPTRTASSPSAIPTRAGAERSGASSVNYYDRREAIEAFTSVSIFRDDSVIVGSDGAPNRVEIARVSPEFFATLGIPLARGQSFTDAEMTYG